MVPGVFRTVDSDRRDQGRPNSIESIGIEIQSQRTATSNNSRVWLSRNPQKIEGRNLESECEMQPDLIRLSEDFVVECAAFEMTKSRSFLGITRAQASESQPGCSLQVVAGSMPTTRKSSSAGHRHNNLRFTYFSSSTALTRSSVERPHSFPENHTSAVTTSVDPSLAYGNDVPTTKKRIRTASRLKITSKWLNSFRNRHLSCITTTGQRQPRTTRLPSQPFE